MEDKSGQKQKPSFEIDVGNDERDKRPFLSYDNSPVRPSPFRRCANCSMLLVVSVVVVMTVLVQLCEGVYDIIAFVAVAYVVVLLLLQLLMMEWPALGFCPCFMLISAIAMLWAPTVFDKLQLWYSWWRVCLYVINVLVVVAVYLLAIRGPPYTPASCSMVGRVCIVTGCNTGIGYDTAEALARAGATVVMACRTKKKAEAAIDKILKYSAAVGVKKQQLVFVPLDLSSLESVRAFTKEFSEMELDLHVLVLNAGAMFAKKEITSDGFDAMMVTNHFGHFLLTMLLLPNMLATEKKGGMPRIVQVSSCITFEPTRFDFSEAIKVTSESEREAWLAEKGESYRMFHAYDQSKLANMLCIMELSSRLNSIGSNIPVNALHPGEIFTEIFRDFHPCIVWLTEMFSFCIYAFLKSSRQGSIGTVYACTAPGMATAEQMTGQFLMRLKPHKPNPAWLDKTASRKLWDISRQITGAPDVPDVPAVECRTALKM